MKITTFVINLTIFTTSVFSLNLNGIALRRRLYEEGEYDAESVVKCNENAMDLINNCIPSQKDSFSKKNIDNLCSKVNSDICQSFLSNPMVSLEGCDNLPYIKDKSVSLVFFKLISSNTKLYCTKDENEKYCPINDLNLFKGSNPQEFDIFNSFNNTLSEDTIFNKTIPNTCKSYKCHQATYDYFSYIKNYTEVETDKLIGFKNKNFTTELNDFSTKIIKYLQKENCTLQAETSQQKYETKLKMKFKIEESNAFSNHLNYYLFFILGLFISIFF